MPVSCADCNHTFLISPDGDTVAAPCPNCGGTRLERDQPSAVQSDGELRNMVDPSLGLDQGGNPLQEGIWAQTDGGWQPWRKRDESFASVHVAFDFDQGFDFGERNATHKFIIDPHGRVHSMPNPVHHEDIANQNRLHEQGYPKGMSLGELYDDGTTDWYQHEAPHSPGAMESMLYGHFGQPVTINPELKPATNEERWGLQQQPNAVRELERLYGPAKARSWGTPRDNEGLVRGGSVDRSLNMEPYMPWTHKADALPVEDSDPVPQHTAVVTPGQYGIHAGTTKWLQFLDAHVDGLSARKNANDIFGKYGMPNSPHFRQPVTVAVHHPEHLAAAVETIEQSAQGSRPTPEMKAVGIGVAQGTHPAPPGIDPAKIRTGAAKNAFLPALAMGLAAAAPYLMKGALMGTGSHMIQGLLGGGEAPQDAAGQQPSMPPRDMTQLGKTADIETPHTNPGYHDSPDGDTHQFDAESTDLAFQNPTTDAEAGGAAVGEDPVREHAGFGPDSAGIERAKLLLPLILHYHNSEESGANDPILRELHDQLEQENPGYLDQADDATGQQFLQQLRKPDAVTAHTVEAFGTDGLQTPQQPALNAPANGLAGAPQGQCAYCGGIVNPDGSCPQCGAHNMAQGVQPPGSQVSMPPAGVGVAPGYTAVPGRMGASHQGPVTDEQKKVVAELLIASDRAQEIPHMLEAPWDYAEELAAVANKLNTPENVDPSDQAPPAPAQEVAPPGATMPVPGMGDPSQGGAPSPYMGKVATPQNGAPRCPNCGSATTGFTHNGAGQASGECHACGNYWELEDADVTHTAAGEDGNTVAVPAADQEGQEDVEQEQDTSHTWATQDGEPLQVGQQYELHSPNYEIPDIVKVDQVKPDAIVVETIGEYSNDPNQQPLSYQHEVTKEEADLQGYYFVPSSNDDSNAGDQSLDQYADSAQAPVNTEPNPVSQMHSSTEPEPVTASDGSCPRCTSTHVSSQLSSATTSFHECFRCGHNWEEREEDYVDENTAGRQWILDSSGPGGDDFFSEYDRIKAARASGQSGSRNLSDIASRDSRYQEIKDRLDSNKREAGKKFTPREQREFIDEQGVARNSDRLELGGTHYESHRYLGDKTNGDNAPDEHLFLGI